VKNTAVRLVLAALLAGLAGCAADTGDPQPPAPEPRPNVATNLSPEGFRCFKACMAVPGPITDGDINFCLAACR
jgi:hypothetical protein